MRLSFNEAQLRLLFGVMEGNLCELPIVCQSTYLLHLHFHRCNRFPSFFKLLH